MIKKKQISLTDAEEKLADLIWRHAPLTSPELVAYAGQELSWKKSTTYTMLKRLCNKGVFINNSAIVSVLMTREELLAHQSRFFVEDSFGGSLPRFITSFIGEGKLTPEQMIELKDLIEKYEEDDNNG